MTTTESQITSGKAESMIDTPEALRIRIENLMHDWRRAVAANNQSWVADCNARIFDLIEAVREKDIAEYRKDAERMRKWDAVRKTHPAGVPCACHFNDDEDALLTCCGAHRALLNREREEGRRDMHETNVALTNTICNLTERAEKAEAERDHFKAIAERQAPDISKLERWYCDRAYGMTTAAEGPFVRFADVQSILSPAQQEPAIIEGEDFPLPIVPDMPLTSAKDTIVKAALAAIPEGEEAASATDAGQLYEARRYCKGDSRWTDWQDVTAEQYEKYKAYASFEVRATPAQATPEGKKC